MVGLQVFGDYCADELTAPSISNAQLFGKSVIGMKVQRAFPIERRTMHVNPEFTTASCTPGLFVYKVAAFFEPLTDLCKADGSLIGTIEFWCRGLPVHNYAEEGFAYRKPIVKRSMVNPRDQVGRDVECPEGYFVASMSITPSGTCRSACDPKGAVIETIDIFCYPTCNYSPDLCGGI